MATLPTEILEEIFSNIQERPIKTNLLLLNRALCSILMIEQVRSLELTADQLDLFFTVIKTNKDEEMKRLPSIPHYCYLLDKIYELVIHIREESCRAAIRRLLSRCTSLRLLDVKSAFLREQRQWNINSIMHCLHPGVVEIRFSDIKLGKYHQGIISLAEYVRGSTNLARLHLDSPIGGTGVRILVESLKENSTITELSLKNSDVRGIETIRILAEYLSNNVTLTTLNLESAIYHGIQILVNSLTQNTTLSHLNLTDSRFGDDGTYALAEVLNQNATLTNLNLSMNNITAEGARALAKCLKQNTALTNLDLSMNPIKTEGVRALAEGLKQNTVLIKLCLSTNSIDNEGARALAECLEQNTVLTNLDLSFNQIGDGAKALAECLKKNAALTSLNLSCNRINSNDIRALVECLKQNTIPTDLNISKNLMSYECTRFLAEYCKRYKTVKITY